MVVGLLKHIVMFTSNLYFGQLININVVTWFPSVILIWYCIAETSCFAPFYEVPKSINHVWIIIYFNVKMHIYCGLWCRCAIFGSLITLYIHCILYRGFMKRNNWSSVDQLSSGLYCIYHTSKMQWDIFLMLELNDTTA